MSDKCICLFNADGQPVYWCAYHTTLKNRVAALESELARWNKECTGKHGSQMPCVAATKEPTP